MNELIINFKTYKESSGLNALKIVRAAERASARVSGRVILVPQLVDLRLVAQSTTLWVFAQHVDVVGRGGFTGAANIDAVKDAGAKGVLINHSEKRLSLSKIKETVALCRAKKLISVVCTKTLAETKRVLSFRPDFVAVEPPELIGGKVSISSAKPKLIEQIVNSSGKVKVLCGAGIHKESDIRVAKVLGASGVLVASGVVKAKNVEREILNLLKGFY